MPGPSSKSSVIRRAYADTASGQLHYRYGGEGEPLLLLHQSAAWSKTWEWMLPDLAAHYRCLAVDTPGYGMSDPPLEPSPTIEDYARYVISFMDALKIERAHIYGHHTGTSIAIEVAAAYPDRVNKLMVNGIPYWEESQEEVVKRAPRLRNWFGTVPLREDGSHLQEVWDTINDMAKAGKAFDSPYDESAVRVLHEEVLAKLLSGDNAQPIYRALWLYDILGRLPQVRAPMMVWTGQEDPLLRNHELAVRAAPHAQSVFGPGGTYFTAHLDAKELTRSILDFLAEPSA